MAARKKASGRSKASKKPAKKPARKKTAAKKNTTKARSTAKKKTTKAGSVAKKKTTRARSAAKKKTARAPAKKKTAAKKKTTSARPAKTAAKKKPAAAPAARKTGKKKSTAKAKTKANSKSSRGAVAPPEEPSPPPTPGRAVIAFSGTEVRTKLGEKWTCFQCNSPFYDLGREAKVCPKCGVNQADKPKQGSSPSPSPTRSARRASRPMAPLLEEDDDAVRYNEEFDLGIQENGGEEEESPGSGDQDLFPDSNEPDEAEESEDE